MKPLANLFALAAASLAVFAIAVSSHPLASATSGQPAGGAIAAPELTGGPWLNTPGNSPISLASRQGRVTVVEFWTFACSNCQANLPAYAGLQRQFAPEGVQVIGIHTPELSMERDVKNVANAVKKLGITYPVLIDGQNINWNRWKQRYWPALYLVDRRGRIRQRWEGELGASGTQKVARMISLLLKEEVKPQGIKMSDKVTKSEAEWRQELSPEAFEVLRNHGTERAFTGPLWDNHEAGSYHCAGCDLELFSSETKFESGTGWPSFYATIRPGAVIEKTDVTFGMSRTEVLCSRCGGHLGHVFDDGPKPTGLRYCMNSAALKFVKK